MVQERVYWDDEEKQIILNKVFELRMQFPEENLTSLLNRAQEILSEDRRRNILSATAMCPWLVDALTQKFIDYKVDKGRIHVQSIEVPRLVSLEEQPLENLIVATAKKFAEDLDDIKKLMINLQSNIFAISKQMNIENQKKKKIKNAPKKTVTIIGLISDQINHLQERYGGRIDLRYLSTNSNTTQVPKKTDYIILMTKFMNHSWQDFVFNKYDRKTIFYCDGGMTKLYLTVDTILSRVKQEYT